MREPADVVISCFAKVLPHGCRGPTIAPVYRALHPLGDAVDLGLRGLELDAIEGGVRVQQPAPAVC